MQLGGPRHLAACICDNPSRPGLGCDWVIASNLAIKTPGEVIVHPAFITLVVFGSHYNPIFPGYVLGSVPVFKLLLHVIVWGFLKISCIGGLHMIYPVWLTFPGNLVFQLNSGSENPY